MQQVMERDGLAQRLGDRRDWFRLGVTSATIVTPLISRWRALRTAERARALWQAGQVASRWPWARPPTSTVEVDPLPPLARREVRTGLWLAGVAVGLVAAGTAAFVIARRRLRADEPPLDVPLIVRADEHGSPGDLDAAPAPTARAAYGEAASDAGTADLTPTPANGAFVPNRLPVGATETGHAEPPPEPRFVGNTETLCYLPADAADLPPEATRVYFATEAQATEAGYHALPGAAGTPDNIP